MTPPQNAMPPDAMPPPDAYPAVRRWKLGHQVFHLQLVVMNTLVDEAVTALRARRLAELSRLVRRLTRLFDAATSTMVYAASFAPEHYVRLIRPSMAPPFVSPGFSGLLNREHLAILAALKRFWAAAVEELGPRRDQWPAAVRQEVDGLQAAIQRNRDHHGFVCERLVPHGESLLQKFFAAQDGHDPAVAPEGRNGAKGAAS